MGSLLKLTNRNFGVFIIQLNLPENDSCSALLFN